MGLAKNCFGATKKSIQNFMWGRKDSQFGILVKGARTITPNLWLVKSFSVLPSDGRLQKIYNILSSVKAK
jgi:hypothetical protein